MLQKYSNIYLEEVITLSVAYSTLSVVVLYNTNLYMLYASQVRQCS